MADRSLQLAQQQNVALRLLQQVLLQLLKGAVGVRVGGWRRGCQEWKAAADTEQLMAAQHSTGMRTLFNTMVRRLRSVLRCLQ